MAHIKQVKIGENTYLLEPAVYAATAGASAITAAITNFALDTGVVVNLKITTANAADATLNVNGTGPKAIRYNNENIAAGALKANRFYSLLYDGTYWQLLGELDTNTTYSAGTGISLSGTTFSNSGVLSIAGKTGAVTLADLGLSNAMHFLGVTTTNVSVDTVNTTATISIDGSNVTAAAGDVVLYGSQEYVWGNSKWNLLGDESSYKVKQTAKADPTASTTTSTTFIDTISQDANGVITATKKTLPTASTTVAGITKVGASGGAAAYSHTHYELSTIGDKRNENTTPNTYSNRLIFQGLKNNSKIGAPYTDNYSYIVGLRGWSDSSGGNSHELAFNTNGIYRRQGATTDWGNWFHLLDSNNYTNYAIAKTAGVTAVTWDSTNNKLTRTINGTAADVVTISTIKTALALTKSDVGLGNVANSTYAGGTAVTLNNSSKASSTASFYAPTTGGTANTQALVGNGATAAPKWVDISPSITIGAGTGSAAPTVNVTVLGRSGTAQSITTASTSVYGVTKLNDGIASNSTSLAATANSALVAAKKVASSNSTSKLYLVGATSQSTTGVDSYSYQYTYTNNGLLSALKVGLNLNGTEKVHLEWNDTDQSIDFVFN